MKTEMTPRERVQWEMERPAREAAERHAAFEAAEAAAEEALAAGMPPEESIGETYDRAALAVLPTWQRGPDVELDDENAKVTALRIAKITEEDLELERATGHDVELPPRHVARKPKRKGPVLTFVGDELVRSDEVDLTPAERERNMRKREKKVVRKVDELGPEADDDENGKGAAFMDGRLAPVIAREALIGRYLHSDAFGWMAYDDERGTWGRVSEKVPAEEIRGYVVRRYASAAKEHARALGAMDQTKADRAQGWMDGWRKAMSAARLAALVKVCRGLDGVSAQDDSFDADSTRTLLNTPSGVIDLETGKITQHDPDLRITTCTRVVMGDEVSPLFETFLKRVLPDEDVRDYVQRWFGCSLLGIVREHILMAFDGTGRNGKGVLRTSVIWTLGDYACEVSPELIMAQQHTQHRTFLMRLRGKRVVCTSETEEGRRLNTTVVKRLTGGDPIEANYMHCDPIEFEPYHSLTLMTNHLPEVNGVDPALWERMRRVVFGVVIPENERDVRLPERLKDEAPGILRWLLNGLEMYRERGLGLEATPASVKLATADYQEEGDLVAKFLRECTVPRGSTPARVLYRRYADYVNGAGEDPITETAFGKDMGLRGVMRKATAKGAIYPLTIMPRSDESLFEIEA